MGPLREWTVVTDVLRSGRRRQTGRTGSGGGGASGTGPPPPSVVVHAVSTAVATALSGLAVVAAVVVVAWVADSRSGAAGGEAARAAADAWLLAHRAGLRLPAGSIGAVPLGLTMLAAVLLHRAGASLARTLQVRDLRAAATATAALAASYGLVAGAVARLAATPAVATSALAGIAGAALLAASAAGAGVLRGAGLGSELRKVLPAPVPAVARAATLGTLALLGAGVALVLAGLVAHAGRFADLTDALDPGVVGGALLMLVCLLLLPNAAVWAVAYAAGPGFAVGAGAAVTPFGSTLGPVPALPLLAAVPQDDTPAQAVRAIVLLPVLAGVVAGVVLARRLPPPASPEPAARPALRAACWGFAAGAGAALGLTLLAALSGGSLGGGYLAAVGPSPWRVLLALVLELGGPAALTAAVLPGRYPAGASARSAGRPGDSAGEPAGRPDKGGRGSRAGSARDRDGPDGRR